MRQELENIPEELELKYLRRNLMCKLLLSYSKYHFAQYQPLALIMAIQ